MKGERSKASSRGVAAVRRLPATSGRAQHADIDDLVSEVAIERLRAEPPCGAQDFVARVLGADGQAWAALGDVVDGFRRTPVARASHEVRAFLFVLDALVGEALLGGGGALYGMLAAAFARRAAAASRKRGEPTRGDVEDAWHRDVSAGRPLRGRIKRIALDVARPESTVRRALAALNLQQPKKRKSD